MTRRQIILIAIVGLVLFETFGRDRYERVMEVHLDVIGGLLAKASSVAASGGHLAPNDLTELLYPLGRARGFLVTYDDHADRLSYEQFAGLVEAYAGLIQSIDAARGDSSRWHDFQPTLASAAADIQQQIDETRRTVVGGE